MVSFKGYSRSEELPISHEGFIEHKKFRYLKIAVILSILSIIGYFISDIKLRPNGGTWLGYTLGAISALLIVWLSLLGVRKRAVTPGKWNLKGWTSAHVYLGTSLLILATLHTGFQFGLNVHTLAYVLMVVVIVSGFFGIYYYATIPAKMSDNRGKRSQTELLEAIRALNRQLRDAATPLDQPYIRYVKRAIADTKVRPPLFGSVRAAQARCGTSRALRRLQKVQEGAPATMRGALEDVIAILQRKETLLLRTRQHIRYKTLLRLWLHVHVPLTLALLIALFAHIFSVFFYW